MEITEDTRVAGSQTSSISMSFNFSAAEIDAAFAANQDALFAKIFSPRWEALPFSEKLQQYVALAAWLEGQAANLNLTGGTVVPKE